MRQSEDAKKSVVCLVETSNRSAPGLESFAFSTRHPRYDAKWCRERAEVHRRDAEETRKALWEPVLLAQWL